MIQNTSTESAFTQAALHATIVVLMTVLCKVACGICSSGGKQYSGGMMRMSFGKVMTDDVTSIAVRMAKKRVPVVLTARSHFLLSYIRSRYRKIGT